MDSALILQPGEGREIPLGNFAMSVKFEEKSAGFSLLEAAEPSGFGPPLHVHDDADEAFYILEGEYIIFLDGEEQLCPAGSFVYIPRGVEHSFRVGKTAGRKLNLYSPAAMVGYFDELSAAISEEREGDDELARIADRYSMRVTGPVPDSYL